VIHNPLAQQLFQDALSGRSNRRDVLRRAAVIGLSAPVAASLASMAQFFVAKAATEGELSVTYYDWIVNLHPVLNTLNSDFGATFPIKAEVAPTQGFGIERFVQETRDGMSTWDMYIGVTPFLEMIALADSGAIEPWDPYLPAGFLDNLPESVKAEGTYNGSFYVWPLLLDIIVQAWNSEFVAAAGLDPAVAPATWDELVGNAKAIQDSGAAPFGVTYDFHAWRSLVPITHSISTDVYDDRGIFLWNSDAAVGALEIMKQLTEYANPDVLNEGGVDGIGPDDAAFTGMQVGYWIKYQNAPIQRAAAWPDPTQLQMSALPKPADGAGGTVFWDTGAVLFKHGMNKQAAADYMNYVSNEPRFWQESVAGNPDEGVPPVGQLPVMNSLWEEYTTAPPEWLTANPWAQSIWDSLPNASAISPSPLSITQFNVAAPFYVAYLAGEEADAKTALTKAWDAVNAEMEKIGAATPAS
jgi:hypothetical protein